MATEANCSTHGDRKAAGHCSRCQMPYCLDCLDTETGQILCLSCQKRFSRAAAPSAPAAGSPLNFKGKGMDDDPLGLMGGAPSSAPKAPAPPASPMDLDSLLSKPASAPPKPLSVPAAAPPRPLPPPQPAVPAPSAPKPAPLDLDGLMGNSPAPIGAPSAVPGTAKPLDFAKEGLKGIPAVPAKRTNKVLNLTKVWVKYLIRHSYEMFDPVAQKLRIPTYLFLGILAAFLGGALVGILAILNRPSVALADTIPPLHIVKVGSGQISEMDVTTYTEFQGQISAMGFGPLLQMTVPQLPSPNFFDVGIKESIGTYSEILKTPGQITPRVSFVTVFTNGVWYSTNGWEGSNQQLEYLVSEFFPKQGPDQLYVKHVQGVEKLRQSKGWQVQAMNEDRYMAALSDHLRWFLEKKGIQPYKAEFALWH